jgi:(p)ppGpp synthase/HD superfamily hydrolase
MVDMEPSIDDTIVLIQKAHAGQFDWTGAPYWTHPVEVMVLLGPDATEAERKAALLHDVVEDTSETIESLRQRGYSEEVLAIVGLVTREKPHERGDGVAQTYIEWIRDIVVGSGNRSAMRVKLADNKHNSSPERITAVQDPVRRGELEQMASGRYARARRILEKGLADAAPCPCASGAAPSW